MAALGWRVGVEIELMAPRGRTRRDLAERLAGPDGRVERFYHVQSEPSLVPGMKAFHTLTPGFRVFDPQGGAVAWVVDDLTLTAGLDRHAAARSGWHRIVSDDTRLLHLVRRLAPPDAPLDEALRPIAEIYGTALHHDASGLIKVIDEIGSPVCIGASLPGERDRPAEIVSAPIAPDTDFEEAVERLVGPARALGFCVPLEAAVHLHFEAATLEDARAVAGLVELLWTWGDALKTWVRTNPRCVRLGPNPEALLHAVRAPDFADLTWPQARARLAALGLSKYVDYNLKNLAHPRPDKPTFEVRTLPGAVTAPPIATAARAFVALLRHAQSGPIAPRATAEPEDLPELWTAIGFPGC